MTPASMDAAEIAYYISETFSGVDVVAANGDSFFFYDPGKTLRPDRRMPFATLVVSDAHDQVSDLNRDGVFRLNIGVARETYRALFGQPPVAWTTVAGHDYAVLDQVLPHPVYGFMSWVCVLNPSPETFQQTVQGYLAEAHAQAAERFARRKPEDERETWA